MNKKRFNEPLKGIPVWATARKLLTERKDRGEK
jgi:hypothetical protein